jgi:rare lipoprotein A
VAAAPVAQAAEVATGSAQGSPAPVPVSQPTPQQVSTPAPQPQPIPQPEPQPAVQSAAPAADTATAAAAGEITDGRRFIQVGVYGKPEYAAWLVAAARAADLPTAERPLSSGNRTLTRLLVGPFDTVAERNAALKTVRSLGAADAFPARE